MTSPHLLRVGLGLVAVAALTWACDEGDPTGPPVPPPPPPPPSAPVTSSEWVNSVDWNAKVVVDVNMVETNATTMSFAPNQLTFEAGKPYVLRINNPAGNVKHYFSPANASSFYQAVAIRKIQTTDGEYKAPYFDAVEMKTNGTSLELFFVPVLPGTYNIICTIPNHESYGMTAQITITGGAGNQLDQEVDPAFNQALTSDPRRSGSHAVWTTAVDVNVAMQEGGQTSYAFVPPDLVLTKDAGYRLNLDNPSGNSEKHYYTAADFYKTVVLRKAEDSQAEIKAPYLNAVELLIGGSTTLFLVPTVTGAFGVLCTIPGHATGGMTGNLAVNP